MRKTTIATIAFATVVCASSCEKQIEEGSEPVVEDVTSVEYDVPAKRSAF